MWSASADICRRFLSISGEVLRVSAHPGWSRNRESPQSDPQSFPDAEPAGSRSTGFTFSIRSRDATRPPDRDGHIPLLGYRGVDEPLEAAGPGALWGAAD